MDIGQIYNFLFDSYAGLGILMGGCLIVCVILAFVLELRTRKRYKDRGPREEDDGLFDWESDTAADD